MRVVVGGASGYIGRALAASLAGDGHEVVALSRRSDAVPGVAATLGWAAVEQAVDGADAVVNLAGAPIGPRRWSARRKAEILSSRVETTGALVGAIAAAAAPPRVLVTASGVDYYGDSGEGKVDEEAPVGSSFLAGVCASWEAAAAEAPVRTAAVRTALVVGPGARSLELMALPFRLFLGGPLGSGRQFFPWVARADLVRIYRLAIEDESFSGPVNAVAPEQLRQRDAARALGAVLHRPARVPAPAAVLRLALGEEADLLLHGQRAVSRRLEGFAFAFPSLRPALEDAFAPGASA